MLKLKHDSKCNSCIIIGSNPSIKEYRCNEYINNHANVIRINRIPNSKLSYYYGSKTDLYVCFNTIIDNNLKDKKNQIA